jgi:3-dehydroquinate dehydratase I
MEVLTETVLKTPGVAVTLVKPVPAARLEGAHYCELRADLWVGGPEKALAFIAECPRPAIFTCRIPREGGRFEGTEVARENLFGRAVEAGAALLDIEVRSIPFGRAIRAGWPVLGSLHDFAGPVSDLRGQVAALARGGARAAKLVGTARTVHDLIAIRELLRDRAPLPAAAFAMGDRGLPSRILALAWGSHLTYVAADASVAPGQLVLADVIGAYGSLGHVRRHIALAGAKDQGTPFLLEIAARINVGDSADEPALVPYPFAGEADFADIVSRLGAEGIMQIAGEPGNFTISAYDRSAQRVLSEKVGDMAALIRRAGSLREELGGSKSR